MIRFAATTPNKYSSIGNNADGSFTFVVNGSSSTLGTEAMKLDSSGNLGLGVTPSAWNSVYRSMQLGKGASISGRSDENTWNELLSNAYRNAGGGWTYLNTDYALAYRMAAGTHQWYTAPSGTAGDAISFTQAMTLDASGHLLLGTTSSSGLMFDFSPTTSQKNGINYVQSSPDSYTDIYGCGTAGGWVGAIRFFTSASAAASERARIDSSGNFIHQVNGTAPSLSTNSTMSFELTSNTSLKIVVRGTDGTTRSATLVLV